MEFFVLIILAVLVSLIMFWLLVVPAVLLAGAFMAIGFGVISGIMEASRRFS
ncbi:hypothetical protein OR1_03996 [Geobacter sp. OR-1]|uniref:hypothetical protein n=1 Tax=Geobacter sp. OR-1 TaxID=1266765 RepID=UPI000542490E|nr:hypothetical protein [Geobacter sp. OR-1]GAM11680.1 hypothetical protein OR1_03996 [Geobacter sp. OR-1]